MTMVVLARLLRTPRITIIMVTKTTTTTTTQPIRVVFTLHPATVMLADGRRHRAPLVSIFPIRLNFLRGCLSITTSYSSAAGRTLTPA